LSSDQEAKARIPLADATNSAGGRGGGETSSTDGGHPLPDSPKGEGLNASLRVKLGGGGGGGVGAGSGRLDSKRRNEDGSPHHPRGIDEDPLYSLYKAGRLSALYGKLDQAEDLFERALRG
jgi:hypothetical protein